MSISLVEELYAHWLLVLVVGVVCLASIVAIFVMCFEHYKIKKQYANIMQKIYVHPTHTEGNQTSITLSEKRKEEKGLSAVVYRELLKLMNEEKAYHDSQLTRDKVAARLGTSRKVFLETLQRYTEMSFTDFVNTFRLDEAISLLENTEYTNETIAEQVGFGSANTFYRQFRTKYGFSPSEYKRVRQQDGELDSKLAYT